MLQAIGTAYRVDVPRSPFVPGEVMDALRLKHDAYGLVPILNDEGYYDALAFSVPLNTPMELLKQTIKEHSGYD